jgi:hypothetical protein
MPWLVYRPRRDEDRAVRPQRPYMESWELYEWHKASGTLDAFLAMYPEP